MKLRFAALLTALAVFGGLAVGPLEAAGATTPAPPAASARPAPNLAVPVTSNTFSGTFNITRFENVNGTLTAVGTASGVLNGAPVTTAASAPVTNIDPPATCQILHLTLGPIFLNLLGLVVTTNQIVVDITSVSGPGNLLGNLLCAVSNLLNPNATGGLASVLNGVLRNLTVA